ncbi:NitT/TauT family transport system permease protein [Rhodopseudomonas rhenobacensis]|uniref:NitT/TauT family transport system permease protein n=1 Tax=Rhodopseudomonas rhenobacensis TaxID=87461 RepID=A0A7W7Z8F5_9BRAD|nr:ABC transporter permease [Rhodopseudomonas rhenobacensis]MBB5049960.1 NitT/TauT family transport system permease protein [Rhodopseudomonas rhenobacensis]
MRGSNLKALLVLLLFVGFWQFACSAVKIDRFVLPSPLDIVHAIQAYGPQLLEQSTRTLWVTLTGLGIAVVVGIPLGLVVGASRNVHDSVYPLMVGFNAVPKVALLPILVVWFGVGAYTAVVTAFALAVFPIVVNLAIAIRTIEPEIQDVLRSLGATRTQILIKIGLPRSLPYFFASLKVSVTLAFVGSVLAETVAGSAGVGYLMMAASARFDLPLVFAGLFAIAAMSVAIYYAVEWFERRTTGWANRGGRA